MFKKKPQKIFEVETLSPDHIKQVHDQIRKISESRVKRFRQEVSGEIDDLLDRETRKYRSKIARRSWRTAQKWCKWTDDGPILMPDYARIYYRKGKTEIVLVEYPPQVRLMRFRGELAKRKSNGEEQSESDASQVYNYALGLPYIVFMFKYVDGIFQEVLVSFSDRPLKKLKERPLRPYLSNIDASLKLCLGKDFDLTKLEHGNIVQQAAYVLSHFWQTVYSNEWSDHFWEYRKRFIDDSKLKDLEAWQAATEENSLFVIENMDWMPHTEDDYGAMIVRLCENDEDNNEFQQELYNDVEDELLSGVKQVVEETIMNLEHKIKAHEVSSLSEELVSLILSIVNAKEG